MNTQLVIDCSLAIQQMILAREGEIESLDRAIGDGDHFINVRRGCEVVVSMREELLPLTPSQAFQRIGMKLLSTIGGASGPLIASCFLAMAKALDGVPEPSAARFADAFTAGVEAIKARGKADVGEKTMLDVLIPVSRLLARLLTDGVSGEALTEQIRAEATRNMLATRDMIATKGRAHFLGERAIGHIDPGSKTCEVVIHAICDTVGAAKANPTAA